jgi:citrate lyase subunit beta / citryl-CoA lyase
MTVPANVPAFVEKAHLRGADALTLDLEDSIPPHQKADARGIARDAIKVVGRGGADVLVRINKPYELAVRDLDAVIVPGLAGIKFPKAETAEEIKILSSLILQRELAAGIPPGSIDLTVSIESARGVFNTMAILSASQRIVAVSYGAEDVTEELGIQVTSSGEERFFGNAQTILAAAAVGIQPLGRPGDPFDFQDIAVYETSVRRGFAMGFKGSSCIHPGQVAPLNRGFTPAKEQVDRARETIAIMEEASKQGRASATQNGRMVDIPSVRRAQRLIERVEAIEAKEARKKEALGVLA